MNRILRERNAYNTGTIKRSRYEKLFPRSTVDSIYLDQIIRSNMAYAEGKVALELGSNAWIGYLRQGICPKKVYCINISEKELEQGVQYQKTHEVSFPIEFLLMDANQPSFEVDSFDCAFGGAILHHLNFKTALKNLSAVIKPGGRIVFHEPLGANPAAKIIRMLTPFARTKDERPLSFADISEVNRYFNGQFYVTGGISTLTSFFTNLLFHQTQTTADRWANSIDQVISKIGFLKPLYRDIIIVGQKK